MRRTEGGVSPARPPSARITSVAAFAPASLLAPGLLLAAALVAPTATGTLRAVEGATAREPCARHEPLRRAFFGDLHVHTAFSLDASTMGTRNRPGDAYRFARGERLGLQPYRADGTALREARLARPLDFAAVTDHAELLGEWNICNSPGLPGHDSWVCRLYRRAPRLAFFYMNFQAARAVRHDFCGEDGRHCLDAARAPWDEIRQAAEAAYDRSAACRFTSFVAYEWTGAAGAGNNFHRNVIFASDVVPALPISFIDSPRLQGLWARLDRECTGAGIGCDAVVIPHNPNLSGGRMFQTTGEDGAPIAAEDARERARYERLVELMQHKGDSECMPGLGSEDELCGFEKLAQSSFSGRFFPLLAEPPTARQFVRNVLLEGLAQERRMGENPFRFGFIASTDTHLGTPGLVAESADYPGHGGAGKPPGESLPVGLPDHLDFNPGGLAVLWAEENSRRSLFAAMQRREAYGTSGPRIVVRFFGGWSYAEDLCDAADLAREGYAGGVPMGGALPPPPAGAAAPAFVVAAHADPGVAGAPGTPLQRIQIVKGWLEGDATHEVVHDVAGRAGADGVALDTCETHGPDTRTLCTVWRDPDFDPHEPAFYYARVLESPTCRWSQKLCIAAGVRCDDEATIGPGLEACCSEAHRRVIQERAWTSPVWYRPEAP